MKKVSLVMIALTLAFSAFAGGFILGRNIDRSAVSVSILPRTTDATQTTDAPEPSETGPLLVDINTASADQLTQLPGIGEVLAQRIVAYREANGPFQSLADLTKVEGIGDKKLESILDYITLGGQE